VPRALPKFSAQVCRGQRSNVLPAAVIAIAIEIARTEREGKSGRSRKIIRTLPSQPNEESDSGVREMKTGLLFSFIILCAVLLSGCTGNYVPPGESGTGIPVTGVPDTPRTPIPEINPETASPSPTPYQSLSLQAPLQEAIRGNVRFVPGGVYHVGDTILISGTTILSPGNRILIEVTSASFGPTNKSEESRFYGASAVVTVEKGTMNSVNSWSYPLDTGNFAPDTYLVSISGITVKAYAQSSSFVLVE